MSRVEVDEFERNISTFSGTALKEPVFITRDHQEHLVLVSAEEYRRLSKAPAGIGEDDKARITRGLERHRATIIELANR